MKTRNFEKSVRKDGAISIPREIRNRLGLKKGTPVSIVLGEDGSITLRLKSATCPICGKEHIDKDLDTYTGFCNECLSDVTQNISSLGMSFEKAIELAKSHYIDDTSGFSVH